MGSRSITFASVCSGIEAASVAWSPLGWKTAWVSEIEKFPSAVLAHHYPDTPNLGDMTAITDEENERYGAVDLVVGGTPCQSFSVAGLRAGLADPRGNLALVYLGLLDRIKPRWCVWENVPGVLSSGGGRDFGAFLGALGQLGYGFAYRVLDAQFYGVAQRRRRVFVVGYLGDWRPPAAAMFESQGLRWNPPPRAPSRENTSLRPGIRLDGRRLPPAGGTNTAGLKVLAFEPGSIVRDAGPSGLSDLCPTLRSEMGDNQPAVLAPLPFDTPQITSKENGSNPKHGDPCHPLAAGAHAPAIAFHNRQDPDVSGEVTHPLGAQDNGLGVAHTLLAKGGTGRHDPSAETLIPSAHTVRRLSPRECERLQGFPDDYTRIPWRGKPAEDCPDGPRYKALGNSMAVPVMRWIGERIDVVENHLSPDYAIARREIR